jgi:hypothetical protein
MIDIKLPNRWGRPGEDPRFRGMPAVSWALSDSFDYGGQDNVEPDPGEDPNYSLPPLEMAQRLEQMTRQIRELTVIEPIGA